MKCLFIGSSRYNVAKVALDETMIDVEYIPPANNIVRVLNLLKTGAKKYSCILIDGHRLGLTAAGVYSTLRNIPLILRMRGDVWAEGRETNSTISGKINEIYVKSGDHFLSKTKQILSVSQFLKNRVHEERGYPEKRIQVIPPTLKKNFINQPPIVKKTDLGFSEDEKILLSVTSFKYFNKIQPLLEYRDEIESILDSYTNMKWIILGDGRYLKSVQSHFKKDSEKIKFLGFKKNVRKYLVAADIFLHLSNLESFGKTVIEAEAMELPVIVNDSGGLKETIQEKKTGLLVSDPNELADRLSYLIENPCEAKHMGEKGREFVLKKFTPKVVGEQFNNVLSQTLGN